MFVQQVISVFPDLYEPPGLNPQCNNRKRACPSALRLDASSAWCQQWRGLSHRRRPKPSQFRIYLPSIRPVCAYRSRFEHHLHAKDDTRSALSHRCCSSDRPRPEHPFWEKIWYLSIVRAFSMTSRTLHAKSSFRWESSTLVGGSNWFQWVKSTPHRVGLCVKTTRVHSKSSYGGKIPNSFSKWMVWARSIRARATVTKWVVPRAWMVFTTATIANRPWRWQIYSELRRFGPSSIRQTVRMEILPQKRVTQSDRKFWSRLVSCDIREIKNHVRRWWEAHDNPAIGRCIIAGTIRRMHQVSKRKGMPVCDYYSVGWVHGVLDKSEKTDMTYKHFLRCSKNRLAVFYVLTTTRVRIFYVFPKTVIFPIVLYFLEKLTINVKKILRGTCCFWKFQN